VAANDPVNFDETGAKRIVRGIRKIESFAPQSRGGHRQGPRVAPASNEQIVKVTSTSADSESTYPGELYVKDTAGTLTKVSDVRFMEVNGMVPALNMLYVAKLTRVNKSGVPVFEAHSTTATGVIVRKNSGANVGTRPRLNLIEGSNITLTVADDSGDNEVDVTVAASGATGYGTVQEEGADLTQRAKLNFIGAAVTAADDAGNTRTNVTLSQSPAGSTSVVGTTRTLTAGTGLSGGGDLSADRAFGLTAPVVIANGGTNSTTALNNNRLMQSSGGAIVEAEAMTDGEVFIGFTGATPVSNTITAGTNMTVTNAPGSITLTAAGTTFSLSSANVTLSTNQDDYSVAAVGVLKVNCTADFNLSGIANGAANRLLFLENRTGSTNVITVLHDSASSAAANRVLSHTGTDFPVRPGQVTPLLYNATDSRWYVVDATAYSKIRVNGGASLPMRRTINFVNSDFSGADNVLGDTTDITLGTLQIGRGGTGQTTKTDAFDALSPLTTKGDLIAHDGTDNSREPVGSNTQILLADSAKTNGIDWAWINDLTEDTSPSTANDFVITYDASAATHKKVKLTNLAGGGGMGGKDISYWRNVGTGGGAGERWYTAGIVALDCAAQQHLADTLQAYPFIETRGGTLDRLGIRITSAGSAGQNARFGIYDSVSDTNLYPGSKLVEGAEVATDSTGAKKETISYALTAGKLYWLVSTVENVAVLAEWTSFTTGQSGLPNILGYDSSLSPSIGYPIGYSATRTYDGTLPSTFPAGAAFEFATSTSERPAVFVRYSA
jgi:hypothetical protein